MFENYNQEESQFTSEDTNDITVNVKPKSHPDIPHQSAQKQQPENTLDEPVTQTIKRDLVRIYSKLLLIILPANCTSVDKETIQDWDLWGPFVFYLASAALFHKTFLIEARTRYRADIHCAHPSELLRIDCALNQLDSPQIEDKLLPVSQLHWLLQLHTLLGRTRRPDSRLPTASRPSDCRCRLFGVGGCRYGAVSKGDFRGGQISAESLPECALLCVPVYGRIPRLSRIQWSHSAIECRELDGADFNGHLKFDFVIRQIIMVSDLLLLPYIV
jgi:hypothetical protein